MPISLQTISSHLISIISPDTKNLCLEISGSLSTNCELTIMYRICRSCSKRFEVDPRVPGQQFCSNPYCQKERKRLWINHKRSTDPDYRENQREAQKSWVQKNSAYWQRYRQKNPEYVRRNRAAQKARNANRKARQIKTGVAKIDESTNYNVISSAFLSIPIQIEDIAKIDAILVRIDIVSDTKHKKGNGDRNCKESTL